MSTTYVTLNPPRDLSAADCILWNQVNIKVPVRTTIEDNDGNINNMRATARAHKSKNLNGHGRGTPVRTRKSALVTCSFEVMAESVFRRLRSARMISGHTELHSFVT